MIYPQMYESNYMVSVNEFPKENGHGNIMGKTRLSMNEAKPAACRILTKNASVISTFVALIPWSVSLIGCAIRATILYRT